MDYTTSICPVELYQLQPSTWQFVPWQDIVDSDSVDEEELSLPDTVMVDMVDVSIPVLPVKRLLYQYAFTDEEVAESMYCTRLHSRLGLDWTMSDSVLTFKGDVLDGTNHTYILCIMVPQTKTIYRVIGRQRLIGKY
jgi:hypothetical protein